MNRGIRSRERKKSKSPKNTSHTLTIEPNRTTLPEIRNHSSITERSKDFNKYYISPPLRYKPKIENPK